MLSIETTDSWVFTLQVTVGAATEAFTNAATDRSAYAAMTALVAWANDAARAWTGTRTFAWSWARDATSGGAILTLSATGGVFDIDGGSFTQLAFAADVGVTSVVGDDAALGTLAPAIQAVDRYYRMLDGEGAASGTGAVRPGAPGLALYAPRVRLGLTVADAARLEHVLSSASSPGRFWVYQSSAAAWRNLALGPVSFRRDNALQYAADIEAAGTPL